MKSAAEDINNFLIIKILIAFVIGILIQYNWKISIIFSIVGFLLSLGLIIFLYFNKQLKTKHKYNILNGLSFFLTWFFFGMFVCNYQSKEKPQLEIYGNDIKYGIISDSPEEKLKSYKTKIKLADTTNNAYYEILAYFEKDSAQKIPQFGDLIAFCSDIEYITSDGNPLEFDYQKYMQYQNIYCRTYIKKYEFTILKSAYKKNIKYYGAKIRSQLIEIYKNSGISGQSLAILEALTLGYKADLDQETISSFQASGAMHILAVSGLHTGIILLITNILLKFLDNKGFKFKVLKSAIIIITLWSFAAITGFSASVCRSALMFSLVTFSQVLNRSVNTYNTIAVSAFILLIINPMLIFNVGFGLSYLAVLAIISFMPLVKSTMPRIDYVHDSKLLKFKKNTITYFWGIILVSIAAQIGTSILSLKTFNMFPTYFLLTNIIVLPLSYIIMICAISLLLVNYIPVISTLVTFVLKKSLSLLTFCVTSIENLPHSGIKGIYLTEISAITLYLVLISIMFFIYYRKPLYMKAILIFLCIFAVSNTLLNTAKYPKEQLIIYNKKNTTLYSIIKNGKMSIITKNPKLNENYLSVVLSNQALTHSILSEICYTDSINKISELFFKIDNKNFLIVNSKNLVNAIDNINDINIDYLIIGNNISLNENSLLNNLNTKNIIFDSSNNKKFVSEKISEYKKLGICCYNINEEGAFVYGDGAKAIRYY